MVKRDETKLMDIYQVGQHFDYLAEAVDKSDVTL